MAPILNSDDMSYKTAKAHETQAKITRLLISLSVSRPAVSKSAPLADSKKD